MKGSPRKRHKERRRKENGQGKKINEKKGIRKEGKR